MNKLAIVIVLLTFAAGCTVGPNYKRPPVSVPDAYRAAPAVQEKISVADETLSAVFPDPELQQMIRTALQQNYDVRIAASRIEQARAQLGITRADQFPTVTGSADVSKTRTQFIPSQPVHVDSGDVQASANWNLDFWGRYRRATEAVRADLLGSEWARREVVRTLVADVARAYLQLRELDLELEISQNTLASRQDSLKLIQNLADHGMRSMVDVRQSEQLVYEAGTTIADLQRRIEQQENFIRILMGQNPGDVARGQKLTEQPHSTQVPAGLTSDLLERRPDIHQAEQQLMAFNARIGVAKAAYFPQISLTASGGYRSAALSDLFTSPAGIWNIGASLVQPIFEGGRIKSGVKFSEAQRDEALFVYQQTIQQAFREVSDALIAYEKTQEFRSQQELLTKAAEDAAALATTRYQGGVTSYLEVLDSNTRYFTAQLGLAQAQLNELLSLVDLYSALGGGWQDSNAVAQSASLR